MPTPILVVNSPTRMCCGAPPGECRCHGERITTGPLDDPTLALMLALTSPPEKPLDANNAAAMEAMYRADYEARLAANMKFKLSKADRLPRRTEVGEAPRMTANDDDDQPLPTLEGKDFGFPD